MPDLNQTNIDLNDPALAAFANDLQGNILRSHARPHQRILLLRIDDVNAARTSIRAHVLPRVTSALTFETLPRSQSFVGLLVTSSGYSKLGGPSPNGLGSALASAEALGDDPAGTWEWGQNPDAAIDLILHVAAKDPVPAQQLAATLRGQLQGVTLVREEVGEPIKNAAGDDIEHFGYVDGVSQPLVLAQQLQAYRTKNTTHHWDPAAPLSLAVVRDPAGEGAEAFGSFLVLRKLEQDVAGFAQAVVDTAAQVPRASADLVGAMAVGRFKNGSEVVAHGSPGVAIGNDFDFSNDGPGRRCPRHAHIRKTNPRAEGRASVEADKARRIFRRGIPYGGPLRRASGGESDDPGPVGLLFL